jgi:hypothetical protein
MMPRSAFHSFPPEAFPITIELLDTDTHTRILWTAVVKSAGRLPDIPGRQDLRQSVCVRVTYGDGTAYITHHDLTQERIT